MYAYIQPMQEKAEVQSTGLLENKGLQLQLLHCVIDVYMSFMRQDGARLELVAQHCNRLQHVHTKNKVLTALSPSSLFFTLIKLAYECMQHWQSKQHWPVVHKMSSRCCTSTLKPGLGYCSIHVADQASGGVWAASLEGGWESG
eukprot:759181-Pelagomonas_calceolata.AAC.2